MLNYGATSGENMWKMNLSASHISEPYAVSFYTPGLSHSRVRQIDSAYDAVCSD